MPTNNQEWWEKRFTIQPTKIDDLCLDSAEAFDAVDNGKPVASFLREELESFLRQEIRQAKIEGMEEAKDIIARAKVGKPQQASDERIYDVKCMMLKELQAPLLESIDQAIINLKTK